MGSSGSNAVGEARREQALREQRIREGMERINSQYSGFTPSFYQKRADDYYRFALPSLTDQYAKTRGDLTYSLANRGLLTSGVAQRRGSQLERETARQKMGIVDTGLSQAQALRRNVEDSRSSVVGQLQASADPSLASQQALIQASQFTAPSTYAPVGNFLQDWANQYIVQKAAQSGGTGATVYNLPSYPAAGGTPVKTVR
jgi:hypothetical protein